MSEEVIHQGKALLEGFFLGITVGLAYDIGRVLRARLKSSCLGHSLDFLFWFILTIVIFLWSQLAWGGYIRLYGIAVIGIGAILYFLTFTPSILWFGFHFADFIQFLLKVLYLPITLLVCVEKKIKKNLKNLFLFWSKWFKIEGMTKELERARQGQVYQKKGSVRNALYTSRDADKSGGHSVSNLSGGGVAYGGGRHSKYSGDTGPVGSGSTSNGRSQR